MAFGLIVVRDETGTHEALLAAPLGKSDYGQYLRDILLEHPIEVRHLALQQYLSER